LTTWRTPSDNRDVKGRAVRWPLRHGDGVSARVAVPPGFGQASRRSMSSGRRAHLCVWREAAICLVANIVPEAIGFATIGCQRHCPALAQPSAAPKSGWRSECQCPGRKHAAAGHLLFRYSGSCCCWCAIGSSRTGNMCRRYSVRLWPRCIGRVEAARLSATVALGRCDSRPVYVISRPKPSSPGFDSCRTTAGRSRKSNRKV
jgi:hypothetical protein